VTGFLKFLGTVNAAIWLGAAIAFTFVAIPAVFSHEMKQLFQPDVESIYGRIAMVLFGRFFVLQYVCGLIAAVHALAGAVYLSRPLRSLTNYALLGLMGVALISGFWLQPKIRHLHGEKYDPRTTAVQKEDVIRSHKVYHGLSQVLNLVALAGLTVYFWRVSHQNDPARIAAFSHKFRG
jgi:hypothetical protein